MVLLRGVFWLSLVAFVAPYSKIDLPNATFSIDHAALMKRVAALPHYCKDNAAVCEKAQALAIVIGNESLTLVQTIAARLHAQG